MFDYHLHTKISFDSEAEPFDMINAAEKAGLREICFTDHSDHHGNPDGEHFLIDFIAYSNAYDKIKSDKVIIRQGIEMGLVKWNKKEAEEILKTRDFDFVLGSIHYAEGNDPYFPEFWEGITYEQAVTKYLLDTLECVKIHDNFDVLGHLNYVCKYNYSGQPFDFSYEKFREITDEIMKVLVSKGKGMEINTSGVDKIGKFLPDITYIKRFKELGGEIVTVGSDAHAPDRVGQYIKDAVEMAKEVFGYVCTFEKRKAVFHKL